VKVNRPSLNLPKQKLLFIFARYIFNNNRHIENDIYDHLLCSAQNAGLEVDRFFADRIMYPQFGLDTSGAQADLGALREKIETIRPDVIVFDANFIGSEIGFNAQFLRSIKRQFGPKLIGFEGDVWGTQWTQIVSYWSIVADRIIHLAPDKPDFQNYSFHDKLCSTAYPVNRKNFFPESTKTADLSFFGSHAYLRPFWLTAALRTANRLGMTTNVCLHMRTHDCPTMKEYAEILRRSRIVLNFSSRDSGAKAMTGRAWQVLNSGVLLLEEYNSEIEDFFVPFIHYVPFENAVQFQNMIEFFHKNPVERAVITRASSEFCVEHYSDTKIWSRLLSA
jgi:hypothetical protein